MVDNRNETDPYSEHCFLYHHPYYVHRIIIITTIFFIVPRVNYIYNGIVQSNSNLLEASDIKCCNRVVKYVGHTRCSIMHTYDARYEKNKFELIHHVLQINHPIDNSFLRLARDVTNNRELYGYRKNCYIKKFT